MYGLLININYFEIQRVVANLCGLSARKYAKGVKKACIGTGFREPIAISADRL